MGGEPKDDAAFLWHHELHEEIAHERLFFALIGHKPYDQEQLVSILVEAFESFNVRSYSIWEVFGEKDVLVRFWLPVAVGYDRFRMDLSSRFPAKNLQIEKFPVDSFECHWELEPLDDPIEVARREINPDDLRVMTPQVPIARRRAYKKHHLISMTRPVAAPNGSRNAANPPTLKVFMWLRLTDEKLPINAEQDAIGHIRDVLQKNRAVLKNSSVFRGESYGWVLVSARIRSDRYAELSKTIVPALHNAVRHHGTTSVTHLSTLPHPLRRVEQLLPESPSGARFTSPDPTPAAVMSLLKSPEGQRLEFKGAALDVSWGKRIEPRSPDRSNRVFTNKMLRYEIARAVAGFLNAGGGSLVIGVLEQLEFRLESVQRVEPRAFEVGENIVVGINRDMPQGSWDKYELALRNYLTRVVRIAPEAYLRIRQVDIEGLALCVVDVAKADRAFWLVDGGAEKYFKRVGNKTDQLEGKALLAEERDNANGRLGD